VNLFSTHIAVVDPLCLLCFLSLVTREDAQETVSLLEENVKDLEHDKESLTSQLQGALEARKEQDKVHTSPICLPIVS